MYGLGALSLLVGGDAGAQRPDAVHRKDFGDLHRDPVLLRPAGGVLGHVLELLRRRQLVAGGLAQTAERDRDQARPGAGALFDAGELGRGEVAVGAAEVEEEVEGRHARDVARV